jgi:hypothetical protein
LATTASWHNLGIASIERKIRLSLHAVVKFKTCANSFYIKKQQQQVAKKMLKWSFIFPNALIKFFMGSKWG